MVTVPAPRGYTNAFLVSDAIGAHTGEAPVDSLDYWMAAAEEWIDLRAGQQWGITTVTNEQRDLNSKPTFAHGFGFGSEGYLYLEAFPGRDHMITLNVKPVVAISAVRARTLTLGASTSTLTANTDYELIDATHGQLMVSGNWMNYRLSIDYTVSKPIPLSITLAATQLVVYWVQPMLHGLNAKALQGIKSYQIGTDLQVEFQDAYRTMKLDVPAGIGDLVDREIARPFL